MEATALQGEIYLTFQVPPSVRRGDVLRPLLFGTSNIRGAQFLFFGRYNKGLDRAEFVLLSNEARQFVVSFADANDSRTNWSLSHRGETVVVGRYYNDKAIDLTKVSGEELYKQLPETAFASARVVPIPANMLLRPGVARKKRRPRKLKYIDAWTMADFSDDEDNFDDDSFTCRLRINILGPNPNKDIPQSGNQLGISRRYLKTSTNSFEQSLEY